jgi:hypothetical protein
MATRKHHADIMSAMLIIPGFLILLVGIIGFIAFSTDSKKSSPIEAYFALIPTYLLLLGGLIIASGIAFAATKRTLFAVGGILIFAGALVGPLVFKLAQLNIVNILAIIYSSLLLIRLLLYVISRPDEDDVVAREGAD